MKNIHPYFRIVLRHILIWTIAFSFFTFIREFGQNVEDGLSDLLGFFERLEFQLTLGIAAGVLFGSYAYILDKYLARKFSFGRTVLISGIGYIIVIMAMILVAFNSVTRMLDLGLRPEDLGRFTATGAFVPVIIFCFIVGFLIEFIQEIDRKFGPGNLWRMLKGTYYHPIEEERLLMFLDMRSSTTIAEQLGHIEYSRLVQDCFRDISVVAKYGGNVYQYVGDEAILTWNGQEAFDENNFVNAFFAFRDVLESRSEYYVDNYGLVPEFKAGVNVGVVTTAEVGEIKREIAFHGDTINTAARIQGKCNELGHDFLASKSVVDRVSKHASLGTDSVGELTLKGKNTKVEIFAIERR